MAEDKKYISSVKIDLDSSKEATVYQIKDAEARALIDDNADAIEAAKTDAANKDAVVLSEAQKYADQAEADAIAAAKTETQNQVKDLADTVYTKEQTYTQTEVNALFTWGEF